MCFSTHFCSLGWETHSLNPFFVTKLPHRWENTIRWRRQSFQLFHLHSTQGQSDHDAVWALHSGGDVTAAPSILNAVALDPVERQEFRRLALAAVQRKLSCRRTKAGCVRDSGEEVDAHRHLLPTHPGTEIYVRRLPAANSRQTRVSRSRAAAREAMSGILSGVESWAPSPGVWGCCCEEEEKPQVHL